MPNTLAIFIYQMLLWFGVLLLWPVWGICLAITPKLRAGFFQKMGIWPQALILQLRNLPREAPVVWIHAVSVGEFLAIEPIITEMCRLNIQPVISCTTQTGYTLATSKVAHLNIPVLYFPFDFTWPVKQALKYVRADLILLTETELWPTFIYEVSQRKSCAINLINGRLSAKSFKGYQRIQFFMQPVLNTLGHCYMQSQADAERMLALMGGYDAPNISVIGNLKFDITSNTDSDADQTELLYQLCGFAPKTKILTIASTHEGEEALLLPLYYDLLRSFPDLGLIIAPRHPERTPHVVKLLREETLQYRLLSELKIGSSSSAVTSYNEGKRNPVVVVDTIGDLKRMFPFSDIVVVAGSFLPHLGGHNILEPMMVNTPVVFGMYTSNFKEIVEVTKAYKAGLEVKDMVELKNQLVRLLTMPEACVELCKNARHFLENHQGQRELLLKQICRSLNWPYSR